MEQQTISVAKAGITTILNSRCAVLAAANPVYGRYDDNKSAADNIDLLPTILSRFDLIFIVRDTRDEARDMAIARHVISVHVNGGADPSISAAGSGSANDDATGDVDMATMKRYIAYARAKCAPRLTQEAAKELQTKYAEIRQHAAERDNQANSARAYGADSGAGEQSVIPITVRQLEALIRVSEAVAKVNLAREATPTHVKEALRLFDVSTMRAAASGMVATEALSPDLAKLVKAVERRITQLLRAGDTQSTSQLKSTLQRQQFDESAIANALRIMERRGEITFINERKTIRRVK
jgi:DNA replication licensing factor MCM5